MLASFIGKLSQGYSSEEALQWGGAAGNATASKIEVIGVFTEAANVPVITQTANTATDCDCNPQN